jgi:tRNA1Val (adenine37-N6)-methyltransferase
MAQHNVVQNALQPYVTVVQGDIRQVHAVFAAATFGTVVCNPPYRAIGHGRLNPSGEKAMARHEIAVTLPQVLHAAQHGLWQHGVLTMVYHPSRLAELLAQFAATDLRPRRLRLVHATLCTPASMVLVDAVRSGRNALTVLPPLCVYATPGVYTAEMQAIFQGRTLFGQ